MKRVYSLNKLDKELLSPAADMAELLKISIADNGIEIYAKKGEKPEIEVAENSVTITYNKKCEFFRMFAMLDSKLIGERYEESPRHTMLCYMADQSRNAVYTDESAKNLAIYLAALGYDSIMLYTEDTYEIEDEPYFGYMRGRWSKERIKKYDAYCLSFGIELIPCIQTLAHLERPLRWKCYAPLIDNGNILLVGDEKVNAFMDKMFKTAAECFKSRRINVGLDEAHMLGLGKYLEKHGYTEKSDIMAAHLKTLCACAKKYGFRPMMWSDMFFSMQFHSYYVKEGRLRKDILDTVPPEVIPIYWDYYNEDEELFENMVKCHTDFNNEVAFAGGLQRWGRYCALNEFSIRAESMHLDKCFKHGITNIIGTAWGDDGSEAASFSIIPSFAVYSEKCYKGDFEREWLDTRVEEVFGIPTEPFKYMEDMDYLPDFNRKDGGRTHHSKVILYSDILTGVYYKHIDKDFCVPYYKDLADKFEKYASNERFGYLFETMRCLALVCSYKSALINDIRDSYKAGDKTALSVLANEDIPKAIGAVSDFLAAFEKQWKKEHLAFGLEVIQLRLGGLKERMNSVAKVITEYVEGKINTIDELEVEPLFADCRPEDSSAPLGINRERVWKTIATVNII